MQATRVCRITVPATEPSTTGVLAQQDNVVEGENLDDVEPGTAAEVESLKEKETRNKPSTTATIVGTACFAIVATPNNGPSAKREPGAADEKESKDVKKGKDPLRMFGLLTPSALREAQRECVMTVEEVLPRIASVDAEMKEVEIRIRRARKWKAKAEAREGHFNGKRKQAGHKVEVEV